MSAPTVKAARRLSSRTKFVLSIAAIIGLLVVIAWWTQSKVQYDDPLDPQNPKPEGAQAVARVLVAHGVQVDIARGQAALVATPIDSDTTLLTTGVDNLGKSTLKVFRQASRAAGSTVLVGSAWSLVDLYSLGEPREAVYGEVAAQCADPLVSDLTVEVDEDSSFADEGCFTTGTGSVLIHPGTTTNVWFLGSSAVMANKTITDADNAALALRLLGQHPRVVWYLPSTADTVATDGRDISLFLPRWLAPSLMMLAVAFVMVMFWRGRRLGALVVEPLPVVVRASETTASLGRLYHRAKDRPYAAGLLVTATVGRLRTALGLSHGATHDDVCAAAALRSGRDVLDVRRLLGDHTPRNDAELTRLGQDLLTLEDEVRR